MRPSGSSTSTKRRAAGGAGDRSWARSGVLAPPRPKRTTCRVRVRSAVMDFVLPPEDDPRRLEVREWLAAHPDPDAATLAEAGYVAPHWPAPWGLGADPIHQLIIDDELRRAGVRRPTNPIGIGWAGPTILYAGTDGAEGPLPVPAAVAARSSGASSSASPERQRPRQPGHPRGSRRRRVRGQRPEDLDQRRAARERSASSSPAPIPTRPSTRASRTSSARWTRRASRSARSPR